MPERVRRALFVQYVNPAMYPPLEHSSRILANQGYEVRFVGVRERAASGVLRFPAHPRIDVRTMGAARPGLRMKLHYLVYCLWCVWHAVTWRPTVVYASDLFATPVGVILSVLGFRVIYHEHDWPAADAPSAFIRLCLRARAMLAETADACVVPNAERAEWIREEVGFRAAYVVWNCPCRDEVDEARPAFGGRLRLLYHGSVNGARLPLWVLDSIASAGAAVDLHVAGYETVGSRGYMDTFLARASELGIAGQVLYHGPVPYRDDLRRLRRNCHLGLSLMPEEVGGDRNLRAMAGASNKPFDYLSSGVCPLVSPMPGWREIFVEERCAIPCEPGPEALADVLTWSDRHREACREIGERGRRRVLEEWNYETQFRPVVSYLHASSGHFQPSP